jgi:predicted MFS family arabinose efflux permease
VQLKTGEIALPLRKDRSVLGVVLLCGIVIVTMVGHNLFYTYISPYLSTVAGFGESSIAPLLFVYGGAGAVGLVVAGFVADRYPKSGLVGAFTLVALSVLTIAVWHSNATAVLVALVVWAVAFGGAPAMLQTRLLHTASVRIRDSASAWYTTSFNFAIGGGALVGGLILNGYGLGTLPFVDAAMLAAGVALILVSNRILRRRAQRRPLPSSTSPVSTISAPAVNPVAQP